MRLQRGLRPVPTDSGTKAEVAVLWSQESVLVWLSGTETDALAGQGMLGAQAFVRPVRPLLGPGGSQLASALAWLAALGM